MEKLAKIQAELHCKKNLSNDFGGYKYRSAEQILEAVKPMLNGAMILLSDEIVQIATDEVIQTTESENGKTHVQKISPRCYVKATATFIDGDFQTSVSAYAREPLSKKGMDEAQVTGATSSYARKYALNGLLCIDNTDDADSMDNRDFTPATTEQIAELTKLGTDFDKMFKTLGIKDCTELSAEKADKIIAAKQAKANKDK